MEKVILFDGVHFTYADTEGNTLDGIDLCVKRGEFLAVIGHNGSGKSTLSKHINALLLPTEGRVETLGMDTKDEDSTLNIRKRAGMVFQNPDNQMVTSIVEDDVAFGPENLGVEPSKIRERVDEAIGAVGMKGYENAAPHTLSGGQKQRIAIAGILAMEPDILILDEPTAMLDPRGRKEVMQTALALNKSKGITVILVTHFMDEASLADRLVVLAEGKIVMEGAPQELFLRRDELEALGLDLPFGIKLSKELAEEGVQLPNTTTDEDLVNAICQYLSNI